MSYRGPYSGILDDISNVAYGNNASFAEFQMKFWLVLPSWFRKLSEAKLVLAKSSFMVLKEDFWWIMALSECKSLMSTVPQKGKLFPLQKFGCTSLLAQKMKY